MKTIKVSVEYRPVRIGWCVRSTSRVDVESAIRHSHLLWGGRCNPLVPIDLPERADEIVNAFLPDLLLSADGSVSAYEFSKRYAYMSGSSYEYRLFGDEYLGSKSLRFVDVFEAIRKVRESEASRVEDRRSLDWFDWRDTDPLADVLLAMLGRLPASGDLGLDLEETVKKELWARSIDVAVDAPLPSGIFCARSLNRLTMVDLRCIGWGWRESTGLFVGKSSELSHVIQYWNVRASGQDVVFYDPVYAERLQALARRALGVQDTEQSLSLPSFLTEQLQDPLLVLRQRDGGRHVVRPVQSISNPGRPIVDRLRGLRALGVVGEGKLRQVSFQLPSMPVSSHVHGQKLVVTAQPKEYFGEEERLVFEYPPVLGLNRYYSDRIVGAEGFVRAGPDGVSVLVGAGTSVLTFYALDGRELVSKIFEVSGIESELSQPGLVAERLIRQMGGLQGCRVFKIAGVRDLIRQYQANQSFTLKEALARIGGGQGAKGGKGGKGFAPYRDLYIEPRTKVALEPVDAFSFLVKREVFKVGVRVRCSMCMLDFWVSIDEMRSRLDCEYCGVDVHVAPQLRDGVWDYRRSGLFGRSEHQDGSIPVTLALQFIDSEIGHRLEWGVVYTAAMNLKSSDGVVNCETDFVALARNMQGGVELVIGECKGGNEISDEDVRNMGLVAERFRGSGVEVYVVLSKAAAFTSQELDRVRAAPLETRRRFILLGAAELESYGIASRRRGAVSSRNYFSPLGDLADEMQALYLGVESEGDEGR